MNTTTKLVLIGVGVWLVMRKSAAASAAAGNFGPYANDYNSLQAKTLASLGFAYDKAWTP